MNGDSQKQELMEAEESHDPLPAKDNSQPSKGCEETCVKVNLSPMELDSNMLIYKFRVDIKKIRQEKEHDLTKGIRTDVATQHRRRVCQSLFQDALKKTEKSGTAWIDDKYSYIYDGANIFYSCKPLTCFDSKAERNVVAVTLEMTEVSSDFSRQFVGNQCERIIVSLEPTLQFALLMTNEADKCRETQQFLEVLTSAKLYKNGDHFAFGNKFYGKSSRNDTPIGEGKCIKPGFEKNIRVGGVNGKPTAYVQIDAKKSPFFSGQTVPKFCLEFLGSRREDDLEHLDRGSMSKLNTQLKSLVVRTLHTEKSKTRYMHMSGLVKERPKDVIFEVDGQQQSMEEFFKSRHNFKISQPRTPCVSEKGRQRVSLYPMEALEIERGQRVNCQKASRKLGEQQIKECRMNPLDLKNYIEDAQRECMLDSENQYLKNFGVSVKNKWEAVEATVLFPPTIKYGNSTVEPVRDGTLNWKLGREVFLKTGKIAQMVFIIFDECIGEREASIFLDKIIRAGKEHGMSLPDERRVKMEFMRSECVKDVENVFLDLKDIKDSYIWCVTKQKFDPVHDLMKALEAKYGVVTQHVSDPTLRKAIGNQGAYLVINNLVMKMNPKSKGVNHMVGLSSAYMNANRSAANGLFHAGRMIFGFDVSHAGPQSFADRALAVQQSEPSIVGMSYSLECATQLGGVYWMQQPRFAGIDRIGTYVAKALDHRRSLTKSLPDDIIVYRGGVSEGEFSKVQLEMRQFKDAFAILGETNYRPSITCIVVMTNSNFRIIPEKIDPRARPMDQNVWPGTVINSSVTNPHYNDFILVAQKGIMGTVRPARCVIVVQEKGATGSAITCDEAQQMTYALAHGHQVVCASTTLPVPLTAATNLSKRGRNVWKECNFRDSDARSALSGSSGEQGVWKHDGSDDFFSKMSSDFQSKLNHHFWA